ncbi:MAG: SIR2 family protein [Lachnospiraceae bacterium]|nr:SIR2 family protein [Lachnospiraceae bacterium]
MNIINNKDGIAKLIQQLTEERLIPIFGAGFSANAEALKGSVPDGNLANEMMKKIIVQCVDFITKEELADKGFSDTAKLFNQLNRKGLLKGRYKDFFRDNFTEVRLDNIKKDFLQIAWPYALTLNVDDAIERTGSFEPILPYLNAENRNESSKTVYKLHGDAGFECKYCHKEATIVFDMDQYTKSLNDEHNQSFRDCVCNTYRDFNMLFIGCSLSNEPDLKYLYNQVKGEEKDTARFILREKAPDKWEEITLEDYGITDVILVEDYERFYVDFLKEYRAAAVGIRIKEYPFKNPKSIIEDDVDLKYFGGYRLFDEKNNCFHRSTLLVMRDCVSEIQDVLKNNNLVMLVGRRFSGKTAILSFICDQEVRNNVFFFPSTALESPDVIQRLLNQVENALLVFDTNALSSESYFLIRDSEEILTQRHNKIIMAVNQSDNYLSEVIDCKEVHIKNQFSDREIQYFKEQSAAFGFVKRDTLSTNLDYLEKLHKEQKLPVLNAIQLPKSYTENEKILLLILCVKDKIYTKDIYSLGISQSELKCFLDRAQKLIELIQNSRGENSNSKSSHKLVHNSKLILLKEIQNFQSQDTLNAIVRIVKVFLNGDSDQRRIYKEVMQFDTLNQLFGRKSGAGRLIFKVYEKLQPVLKEDLHYWLQRAKSIYRLVSDNQYFKLKEAYGYAKKVYMDSNQKSLTAKAALTTSLICCLLYRLERSPKERQEYQKEAIRLGHEAIRSEYYRFEDRLNNELDSSYKGYRKNLIDTCKDFLMKDNDRNMRDKASEIVRKFDTV